MTGNSILPGKINYLAGSDPSGWHRDLPTYAQINYADLYPGVNLTYEGEAGRLKGTYTLAAGADAERIRWRYQMRNAECGMRNPGPRSDCPFRPQIV